MIGDVTLKLWNIGWDLIQGLLKGIEAAWEGVKTFFTNAAETVKNFLKDPLSIRSPSGVFMEIGKDIMDGLRIGLANGLDGVRQQVSLTEGVLATGGKGLSKSDALNKRLKELGFGFAEDFSVVGGDFFGGGRRAASFAAAAAAQGRVQNFFIDQLILQGDPEQALAALGVSVG